MLRMYGMVWYGMVWYGMLCYVVLFMLCCVVLCYMYVRTYVYKKTGWYFAHPSRRCFDYHSGSLLFREQKEQIWQVLLENIPADH